MKNRSQSGAAIAFIAAASIVFVMIIFCFFVLSLQIGGSRELLHATDAGSLNVGREAIRKPEVALQDTEESLNFSAYVGAGAEQGKHKSDQIQVSLANYNRIVGQTLLVALNAQAEGTADSRENAEKLIDVVQGANGIGAHLRDALSNKDDMGGRFTAVSFLNSVRMLGGDASARSDNDKYEVAYLEPGASSNVDFDPKTLPYSSTAGGLSPLSLPSGSTTKEQSNKKLNFISGYKPISIPGLNKAISGVPVMPGKAPHLISKKDFNARTNPPGLENLPPNSFKSGGAAGDMRGIACSVVGALDTQFTASITHGYLLIENGPAGSFSGVLGGADQIFARELMDGIYVGPGTGAARTFTTDLNLYNQWLSYNNARKAGTPAGPEPSRAGMHGADPATITGAATLIRYTAYGQNPEPTAAAMLGAFVDAYPHANAGTSFASNQLSAVELFKARVSEAFGKVTHIHDPNDPAYRQDIPAPTAVTGMKAFDHDQSYAGTIAFGKTGSLREFLTQCNAGTVLAQVEQRMHQINPEASEAEISSVLDKECIGMGQTLYIYKAADNKLCISSTPPAWISKVSPDGKKQIVESSYDLIGKSVNVPHDGGAPLYPFDKWPAVNEGIDSCSYTPSSGYRNLLGVLNFSNRTVGGGNFWDPN